jgi:diguanylate cyclase
VADSAPLRLPSEEVQRLELLAAHVGSALQTAATLAELQAQASLDALTGLGHNAAFHARLAAAQERDPTRDVAVLLLDVDGLKRINDTQGHAAGDEILAGVADVLDETLPESGRVFRVGGDEFAAVAHVDDEDDALAVAQRLCTAVKEQRHVTVSVGVATTAAADGSGQVDTLLADADLALDEAKRRGRSRVISYHPALRAAVLERARLAAELSGAVRRDELHIVYQPVVALDSGDVVALEALVRWKRSSRGPVSPGEFISIAEEDGQIIGIGDWVLEMACHQLDAWNRLRGDAFPLRMSVNVSGAQLTPSFDRMVRGVLADSGVPPPQLVLEMTERVFVDDPDAATRRSPTCAACRSTCSRSTSRSSPRSVSPATLRSPRPSSRSATRSSSSPWRRASNVPSRSRRCAPSAAGSARGTTSHAPPTPSR